MIVIIDYGMGNLGSIANMFKKIGTRAIISSDLEVIEAADKLILPGVGAFDNGMARLGEMGLVGLLNAKALLQKTPILGLCLGMQLLARGSEEGSLPGLGWLDAGCVRFRFGPEHDGLKVPHMGWNYLHVRQPGGLFAGMYPDPRFYFVHAYHLECKDQADVQATTTYGYEFASVVRKNNILGVQFHPEKSHKFGMKLFTNFVEQF